MNLNTSPEIAAIVDRAAAASIDGGQFFVGVEHLFAALLDAADTLPAGVRSDWLPPLVKAQREMGRTAWKSRVATPAGEVAHSPRAIKALMQAGRLAQHARTGTTPGHLLLALLSDGLSAPSRAMDRLNLDRGACIKLLQKELNARGGADVRTAAQDTGAAEPPAAAAAAPALESLTRNLSQKARRGELQPAIGRDEEIMQVLQALTRKNKNNVILTGEAGVGKTQLIEGLALYIAKNPHPGTRFEILELNMAMLMAGTQYRGAFEEKLLGLIAELKNAPDSVLFVDEIHLIMGAGATDGDGMDMANLLKPALARGEIRCIGATTVQEYRKFIEKDPALERRFQMVRVEELSGEATLKVLQNLRPSLEKHHGVLISSRALQTAIHLTERHLPNLRLPDKAIDVIDQACAGRRLQAMTRRGKLEEDEEENKITPHDIRKVISQMTGIPLEEVTGRERAHLTDLERRIRKRLIGQEEAVARAVASVKKSRAGLADPNRPDAVMLFLGPSGVGKTHLAKALAEELFGSSKHLVTFDMSEYVEEHSVSRLLGAPPGYVGHEEEGRLSSAVRSNPFSILLFDEIEKAHPRVFDIFLSIFEEGRLKDARGREISFRSAIIILTSNIGAELLARDQSDAVRKPLMEALRKHFRPEFINRIDDIVPFFPLLSEDIRSILWLEMKQIKKRLDEKQIGLQVYQLAYEHLAMEGYSPEYGARELRRVVDRKVTTPISELIISGDLDAGDTVEVLMDDDRLLVRKGVHKLAFGQTPG